MKTTRTKRAMGSDETNLGATEKGSAEKKVTSSDERDRRADTAIRQVLRR